ncbi:MAG: TonB-dependent receptor, partial [Pedobacter sp.]
NLGNSRTLTSNDYLTGNVQLKYNPINELSLLFRVSMSNRNVRSKNWNDRYTYSAYRTAISGNAIATLRPGNVGDGATTETQLNPEFQAQYIKQLSSDFSLNAILGSSLRDNYAKTVNASSSNMVIAGLYNVQNTRGNTAGSESNSRVRQIGVYADARLGYKSYLYLHLTARNDWRSVLAQEFRSLFYPAADISFIASDALDFLKESKTISSLKIRGGISKVGLVNLGAYRLQPTFVQQSGFPYSGIPGFGFSNALVSPSIKPEVTTSLEGGFDLELYKSRVNITFTAYKSNTVDQTVPVGIPSATGYTTYLINTGEVENKGLETSLRVVPVRTASGLEVSVGANYTYNKNKVLSISSDQNFISIGSFGTSNVVAQVGESFPLLKG